MVKLTILFPDKFRTARQPDRVNSFGHWRQNYLTMWLLLDTKTITRLDYYGQPYETTVFDDKRDLGEMWRKWIEWKDRQPAKGRGHYDGKGYMAYEQRKLMEDNI